MISLIVSSRNLDLLVAFKKNVEDTIGVAYEIIATSNQKGELSIFEVYNRGALQARFSHLLFIHEDVQFKTKDWGKKVLDYFQNLDNLGVLGIGGTKYFPSVPSGWFFVSLAPEYNRLNILQGANGSFDLYDKRTMNPDQLQFEEVAVLDGVFLAIKKKIWEQFRFDSETFDGFHFYDIDFCLRVAQSYKNYVVYDIDLIHASGGSNNKAWIIGALKFYRKWKKQLPFFIGPQNKKHFAKIEWVQFFYWIKLVRNNFSYFKTTFIAFYTAPFHILSIREYMKFCYYVFVGFIFRKGILKND